MMKKLLILHRKFHRQIWMGIVDGQIHVAINQPKSFFQPGLFSKVNENTLGKQRKNIEELTILINEIMGNHELVSLFCYDKMRKRGWIHV